MLTLLGNLLHNLAVTWAEWRRRRQAFAELSALDDRSLADIGISRSEIPYVLSDGARAARPTPRRVPADGKLQHAA
jgi:uncharacterized protein YjiS (DUF1127 family)